MQIWAVELVDKYEGPCVGKHFLSEKKAFAYAKREYAVREFIRQGIHNIAWISDYDFIDVFPIEVEE